DSTGYRTFGVVFIPGFGWCGGRNWGFELVGLNCEVGQDVLVEGRFLPVTARESRVLSCSCCVRVHEYSFLPYLQCENDASWLHQRGAAAVALSGL
ncbi:MAG: hypothetical protein Q605_AUC01146G0001, partial [Actinomyces urogenitalis DORA_12]